MFDVLDDPVEEEVFLYDHETKQCYLQGNGVPCKKNMNFYPVQDKPGYGFCDCDEDIEGILYNPETDGCHQLFQRVTIYKAMAYA